MLKFTADEASVLTARSLYITFPAWVNFLSLSVSWLSKGVSDNVAHQGRTKRWESLNSFFWQIRKAFSEMRHNLESHNLHRRELENTFSAMHPTYM
jgi:hypothetical protein